MPEGAVALSLKERRHLHRADAGDAPQVVAQHIHDHDVFGTFFGRRVQRGGLGFVFGQRASAAGGAFHRAAGDVLTVQRKEEFGRSAADNVTAYIYEGGIFHRLGLEHGAEECPGIPHQPAVQTKSVVYLIGFAACNALLDLVNRRAVSGARNGGRPRFESEGLVCGGERVAGARRRVESKPQQWKICRGAGDEGWVKGRGCFVADKASRIPAILFHQLLHAPQRRDDFIQP